ncbi:MAG: hypothetical protein Fur0037_03780 [Planctomycetota bacterium]
MRLEATTRIRLEDAGGIELRADPAAVIARGYRDGVPAFSRRILLLPGVSTRLRL